MASTHDRAARHLWSLILLVLLTGGCSRHKALDRKVDRLVNAIIQDDYDAVTAMYAPGDKGLNTDALKKSQLKMSRALRSLGPYRGCSKVAFLASNGALRGKYWLHFAKAEVGFQVVVLKGQLRAFWFEGNAYQDALSRVQQEK